MMIFWGKETYVKCKIVKIKADLCTKSVKWFQTPLFEQIFRAITLLFMKLLHLIRLLNMPMLIMTLTQIIMLIGAAELDAQGVHLHNQFLGHEDSYEAYNTAL